MRSCLAVMLSFTIAGCPKAPHECPEVPMNTPVTWAEGPLELEVRHRGDAVDVDVNLSDRQPNSGRGFQNTWKVYDIPIAVRARSGQVRTWAPPSKAVYYHDSRILEVYQWDTTDDVDVDEPRLKVTYLEPDSWYLAP